MVWIEDHPGSIEQGIVRDFVQWYQPQALADEPASDDGDRITIIVPDGASDAEIGELLWSERADQEPARFPVGGHGGRSVWLAAGRLL